MDDRQQPGERHRAGLRDHVLLGDPALEEAVGKRSRNVDEAAVEAQVGVEHDQARLLLGLLDERVAVGTAPAAAASCGAERCSGGSASTSSTAPRPDASSRAFSRAEISSTPRSYSSALGAPEW